ncbi:hypothetical protein NBRC116584_35780 [Hydrogenophaga sp. 5NK40-0174]
MQQLVVKVPCGFSGDAREIAFIGRTTLLAMTKGTGHEALLKGIGHPVGTRLLTAGGVLCQRQQGEPGAKTAKNKALKGRQNEKKQSGI